MTGEEFLVLDIIILASFIGVYGILEVLLLWEVKKVDKIARPYLISMISYFVIYSISALFIYFISK